jgi:hypothetical protein
MAAAQADFACNPTQQESRLLHSTKLVKKFLRADYLAIEKVCLSRDVRITLLGAYQPINDLTSGAPTLFNQRFPSQC